MVCKHVDVGLLHFNETIEVRHIIIIMHMSTYKNVSDPIQLIKLESLLHVLYLISNEYVLVIILANAIFIDGTENCLE